MSRISFRHPSHSQLAAWLDGTDHDDAVITMHVDGCERCAARLDELATGGDDEAMAVELADALREVYEPPADLTERVLERIDERERVNREINLFLGLFAIGKDAAELLMPSEDDET